MGYFVACSTARLGLLVFKDKIIETYKSQAKFDLSSIEVEGHAIIGESTQGVKFIIASGDDSDLFWEDEYNINIPPDVSDLAENYEEYYQKFQGNEEIPSLRLQFNSDIGKWEETYVDD